VRVPSRGTTPGTTLLIASGNGHVLTQLRALARDRGLVVERCEATLWITGDALPAFVVEADGHLTATERTEARALYADAAEVTDALVGAALLAPSIGTLAARARETGLEAALEHERGFFSRYQPIVELATGTVVAHEALLRADIDGEEVLPERLFGIAGSTDRLHALDRIGRDRAIQGAQPWLGDQLLFVKLNPTSVYRPALCLESTARAVDEAGLALEQLVFEVVESHRVADRGHLVAVLDHYRSMGCRIALDDVGAGYSSLLLAAAVRPEVVKLDGELVRALPHDQGSVAVVKAIVALSHTSGRRSWRRASRPTSRHGPPRTWGGLGAGLALRAPRASGARDRDRCRSGAWSRGRSSSAAAPDPADGRQLRAEPAHPRTADRDRRHQPHGRHPRGLPGGLRQRGVRAPHRLPPGGRARSTRHRPRRHRRRGRHDGTGRATAGARGRAPGLRPAPEPPAGRVAEHLERELHRAERADRMVALLYCDLDGFKDVNDRFGHALGDEVLVRAVRRIEHVVRAGDLLVRQGGDEFLLVLADLGDDAEEVAAEVTRHVTAAFARPFAIGGQDVALGLSVGWSLCPRDGTTPAGLLARADAAMYEAKRARPR